MTAAHKKTPLPKQGRSIQFLILSSSKNEDRSGGCAALMVRQAHHEDRKSSYVSILFVALKKASISFLLPIEMRPTVGQIGQRSAAICTLAAL